MLKVLSALILAIGLSVAAGIYFFTPERDENLSRVEIAASKQYNRTLQRFGGRASVMFDEMQEWFAARWRGKQLGVTIAWLSVGVAGVLYLVARSTRR